VAHRAELVRLTATEAAARSRTAAAEELITILAHDFRTISARCVVGSSCWQGEPGVTAMIDTSAMPTSSSVAWTASTILFATFWILPGWNKLHSSAIVAANGTSAFTIGALLGMFGCLARL